MGQHKSYVIADTHFGHKNLVEKYKARPFATIEEHDRQLIERWNATVGKYDTVWVLGDVFFGACDPNLVLGALTGIKKLIMGNHDYKPLEYYTLHFSRIYGAFEYGKCILTHIPVHPNQLVRYKKNIHGHMHGNCLTVEDGSIDERYACVSAEHLNYTPILLQTVIQHRAPWGNS